jgi:hypothetical protein
MDPTIAQLIVSLGELATRNTATSIVNRIAAVKAKRKNEETIQVLTEIVNDLIRDRDDLITVAQGLKEEFVSQQINDDDIEHIVKTIIPLLELLGGQGGADSKQHVEVIHALLSKDTLKILQVLGFNYRRAIGEPLTQVVQSYVISLEKQADGSQRQAAASSSRRKSGK